MELVIVESPAKAKTIKKYLGKGFTVKASVGHIRDLPKSNKNAIDIKAGFVPHYVISEGKEKVVAELKRLSIKANHVLLATDPDREGEAIAWHIKEATGAKNAKRIVFHEITKSAITEAMGHPREIDEDLLRAQEARRVLDRLFGYDLSGLIWKKVRYGLSAGRVQSPALRILMEREREIRAFTPETFWTITALLQTASKEEVEFTCSDEPRDKKEMEHILDVGKKNKWSVVGVKETETRRAPRAPFITSTLQQTASTRLGFTPARTMMFAQRLYEAGLITYMRTDSITLSKGAQAAALQEVAKKYGKEYVQTRVYKTKSKSAQEAHEAIRPTDLSIREAGAGADQEKLYALIWKRTMASQMSDAKVLKTKIVANVKSSETEKAIPDFGANGSRVLFDGWLAVDPNSRGDDVELPKVSAGEMLRLKTIDAEEKQTQPPSRYSEAGLVKELERRGIGRPSTYAPTIKTLLERGYVEKEGKTLHPTDTGDVVSSFLEKHFTDYISDSFTAEMEDELDDIANGKRKYLKTLKDFYGPFSKEVKSKEDIDKLTTLGDADASIKCPECGGKMVIKLGKSGKFLSCAAFPECSGARTIDGKKVEGPKETGEECPECDGKLVEREGKYGKFISCGNYPKCKYIKKENEDGTPVGGTGVKCPKCKKGELSERRGRFGVFYGCSNYPACKYAIKAKPTGRKCPECDSLMMEGTKTIPERCSDKVCPNHRPDKL
ncbi:MAG: type I DNA topoisomerase [Patescibacteria group bacterium]|nr:MAG: type I DNA topoisomerase [Patescibacteria group bacterium]